MNVPAASCSRRHAVGRRGAGDDRILLILRRRGALFAHLKRSVLFDDTYSDGEGSL
jgi:hypothetical protein